MEALTNSTPLEYQLHLKSGKTLRTIGEAAMFIRQPNRSVNAQESERECRSLFQQPARPRVPWAKTSPWSAALRYHAAAC
jgi:hypothetical protein